MQDHLEYGQGDINDLVQLRELGIAANSQHLHVLDDEGREQFRSGFSNELAYQNLLGMSTVFTCRRRDKIVGMAFLVPSGNPTDIYPSDWCYIRFVGVEPSFSGRGIAKQLTKMCIEKAKASHEKTIALHTSEFMDAARHLYENMGFTQFKEIAPRFGKRYWLYTLPLED